MLLQPNPLPEADQKPLPLFRVEAIAAQQQRYYGEILLIRPFSLSLFFWLGMGISTVVLGFLLFATYTERIQAAGIVVSKDNTTSQAEVYAPAAAMKFIRVGESLQIRCQSCSGQESQIRTARVSNVSNKVLSREDVAPQSKPAIQERMYKITLTLPVGKAGSLAKDTRIEADLPWERKSLLQWLFEKHR